MSQSPQFQLHTLLKSLVGMVLLQKVIPVIASAIFIMYIVYLCWMSFLPQKPIPDSERKKMADIAITKIIDQLRDRRGNIRQTVLVHFANDPTDYFTHQLGNRLDSTGILNLQDRTLTEKIRNKLNLRNEGCHSLDEALKSAKRSGADGVLWGSLSAFESTSAGALVTGNWQLAELKTGEVICSGEIHEDTTSPQREQRAKELEKIKETLQTPTSELVQFASTVPWYIRFLTVLLLVLLLPIVTIAFLKTMLRKRSNKINLYLLLIYTLIDAIFAFFMVGCEFVSGISVLFFLIATGLALFYNHNIMSFIVKLES